MENQKNQQGFNLSEEKVFERIGRLVMINEQLSEALGGCRRQLQEVVDENARLLEELRLLKDGGTSKKKLN